MGMYLFQGSYTAEGAKGLLKEGGTGRRKALETLAASLGGKLQSLHFGFGDRDAYALAELPDNETAASFSLTAAAAGMASVRTVVLLTPEELDKAAQKKTDYRAPGK